ncbi:MAG: hypothetical protein A2Y45_06185 [Tenericutes bacterium GWC2_34_14]|nr:MAG: hypothetical protein A2Z84_00440 [Tenericutes bacterium GWA2_35_7]OHE28543.1 MAG: hypothetical protein A2Y45_06185 [Tenericutes bacterium GWC2_34_14]OHE33549.1 MAG: hypothetical protein A2012_03625 [Tenericutes bacterium GWE2_34_108]OHE36834.1 MAG: hypothetical protein A2Y46_09425 [Tenericutes bacterium GWF1_35_14]OHE38086.1 MAG: hypothetical protein A2Y44_09240 [Tenericutes bacterium GWF2_35_184]OHE42109.1 MAG: hypothetical protein A3K26_08065 [Tenericutes bacterium RIFOXYA12_FULL_35_
MRLVIAKVVIFIFILTIALVDYRMLTFKDGKVMVANWHQLSSWSEVEDAVLDIDKAEVYPSRVVRRSNSSDEHYLVIYMNESFYNIKATDLEMARISNLMAREQVEIIEVKPVDVWFYGMLVVLLVVFPVMRKEKFDLNS